MATNLKRARLAVAGSSGVLSFVASVITLSEQLGGGVTGTIASLALAGFTAITIHQVWPHFVNKVDVASVPATSYTEICSPGPYEVSPGGVTRIPLQVVGGDLVTGHLAEMDNHCFCWQILDESNYVRRLKRRRVIPVCGEENVPASKVDWRVPNQGPWFLVLSVPGKQIAREVEIRLRKAELSSSRGSARESEFSSIRMFF